MSNIKIVKFHSPTWCVPCRQFAPIYEEVQEEYPDFEFGEVDINEAPFTTSEYQVTAVPTVLVLKDGSEVERVSGVISKPNLRKMLDTYK